MWKKSCHAASMSNEHVTADRMARRVTTGQSHRHRPPPRAAALTAGCHLYPLGKQTKWHPLLPESQGRSFLEEPQSLISECEHGGAFSIVTESKANPRSFPEGSTQACGTVTSTKPFICGLHSRTRILLSDGQLH